MLPDGNVLASKPRLQADRVSFGSRRVTICASCKHSGIARKRTRTAEAASTIPAFCELHGKRRFVGVVNLSSWAEELIYKNVLIN